MNTLRISFAPDVSDSGGAVIPVRILDSKWKQVPGNWALTLGETLDVPVQPGSFTVQAFLPTGEVIDEQVTVAPDQTKPVPVELMPQFTSPRESLAWSYLLKGTSRSAAVQHLELNALESMPMAPALEFWALSSNLEWQPNALPAPRLDYGGDASFGMGSARTVGKLVWLRVTWGADRAKFVALPPAKDVRFNLFSDPPEVNDGDPINVVVDAGNPQAETILGFLRRGDFASARQAGASFGAEKLLEKKVEDPASAAIGAYFLLQASDLDRLHNWTWNLSDWFKYIPDGAVIFAWHALRSSQADFKTAREQLLEAVRRGLPVYTVGLRLLDDGLALFAARAAERKQVDPEVERAREKIAPFVAAADWTSATTSFYGLRPDKPQHFQ